MSYSPIVPVPELVRPDYVVYDFTNGIFKIVRHKNSSYFGVPYSGRQKKDNVEKLDPALSRARRVVLELGLCNKWEYFCTFTISKDNYDRYDLVKWKKDLGQWLRDQRKKYPDIDFKFVLVPEQHKDGSWHMHGLFSDITPLLVSFEDLWLSGEFVPFDLVKGGYYNWQAYQNKFGFCSFGKIKNNVAVGFYITKYLSKQLADNIISVGKHLYYPSRGLNRAEKHGDGIYGYCGYLDNFLVNHYEFCSTGMTHSRDNLSWDFALEYMTLETLDFNDVSDTEDLLEVDKYQEAVQSVLAGF